MSCILFYGDPHGQWQPLLVACDKERPDAVVILGDCDLERPLSIEVAPILKEGIPVHWIPGNHDSDRGKWFANLFHGGVDNNLNGRVAELAGVRVAGLGGTFQEAVWHPHLDSTRFSSPDAYLDYLASRKLLDGRERLAHTAIFPDVYNSLADHGSADVLVTHEAPSCHRYGHEELDLLGEALGVKMIVHGHHHESYESTLNGGIKVHGLGRAEPRIITFPGHLSE